MAFSFLCHITRKDQNNPQKGLLEQLLAVIPRATRVSIATVRKISQLEILQHSQTPGGPPPWANTTWPRLLDSTSLVRDWPKLKTSTHVTHAKSCF